MLCAQRAVILRIPFLSGGQAAGLCSGRMFGATDTEQVQYYILIEQLRWCVSYERSQRTGRSTPQHWVDRLSQSYFVDVVSEGTETGTSSPTSLLLIRLQEVQFTLCLM